MRADREREGSPAAFGLLVAAASLALAWPVLGHGFVNWDDDVILSAAPNFCGGGLAGLRWMATTLHNEAYQPLGWLALGLSCRLGGLDPLWFHAASLVLHAANAALLFLVGRTLLGAALPSLPTRSREWAAAAGALLFASHPLQVESVAHAAAMPDLLSATFFLGSVLAYLFGATAVGRAARTSYLAVSFALFVAAGLSRWKAVALPVALILLDLYPLRRLGPDLRTWLKPPERGVLVEKLPFLAIAALVVFANAASKPATGGILGPGAGLSALGFYLRKLLSPTALLPVYVFDPKAGPGGPLSGWGALAALAATAGAVLARRRWPAGLGAWVFFAACLAPTFALSGGSVAYGHDRNAYVACMGLALAAAGALAGAWSGGGRRTRRLAAAAALLALGAWSAASRRQLEVWRDSQSLWRHHLSIEPSSPIATFRYSSYLRSQGRYEDAIDFLQDQERLNPEASRANLGLAYAEHGLALFERGEEGAAIDAFDRSLTLGGDRVFIFVRKGAILERRGRLREAAAQYRAALLFGAKGLAPELEREASRLEEAAGRLEKARARERRPGLHE